LLTAVGVISLILRFIYYRRRETLICRVTRFETIFATSFWDYGTLYRVHLADGLVFQVTERRYLQLQRAECTPGSQIEVVLPWRAQDRWAKSTKISWAYQVGLA